jgi:cytochrome c oxidase subunit 4
MSMSEHSSQPTDQATLHPSYTTVVVVWIALVILTGCLVLLSHFGLRAAVWGLLTITPLKAGLVFYFFMHLRYEDPLLKGVIIVALVTLLIFLALLFSDVAFA